MIKLLIADDHRLMREGLSKIIEEDAPDIVVAACAADGNETMALLESVEIHVILLDLSMPGPCGMPLILRIRERAPRVAILVLTMYDSEQYAVRAIQVGAMGFLTKAGICPAGLIGAIRKVAAGQPIIDSAVAVLLAQQPAVQAPGQLSVRERQVFDLLVAGETVTDIAKKCGLSVKTISTFKTRICHKLHVKGVADLVQYAVEKNLIDPSRRLGAALPADPDAGIVMSGELPADPEARIGLSGKLPAPPKPDVERRSCKLTESKVNVAIILREMLGRTDASSYLTSAKVPVQVSHRVLANASHFRSQEVAAPAPPSARPTVRHHSRTTG